MCPGPGIRLLRVLFVCVLLFVMLFPRKAVAAFGLSTATDFYTVDTGAGLVFKVRRTDNGASTQSAGDLMSLAWNGVEYQDQSRGSQINSGFDFLYNGFSSVTVTAAVINVDYIKVTVLASNLTHYYMARRGHPHIYMATHFTTEPDTLGLCRFIVRVPATLLPNGPAPSDIRGNTGAIESADIFGMADGTTRSKHYSNMRLKDWSYIGATGNNVGLWIVRSNHEGDSGGPFYRSLLNQCGSDQEITYIINYGEAQTEPFRTNILNGPYTMVFTTGSPPASIDTSWVASMGLVGFVGPAGRGAVRGSALLGRDTSYDYTVAFANGAAQYWTDAAASNGAFLCPNMLPGTYTMRVFKNEFTVHTASATVSAGTTNNPGTITIANDPSTAKPLWRIGNWDGTPNEFLNADKVTTMHPNDVRMSDWSPGTFVIGSSSPSNGIPCYQWKDTNGSQVIQFTLNATQLLASTVRVGITVAFEGARPKIQVNAWTSSNPNPSTQPDTRTLTVGTYRGNNTTYTFSVPASAFVLGTNTMTVFPISGSGASGFLSAGYSLDCIDMYQGALQILPIPAAPTNFTATATNLRVTLKWNASPGASHYVVARATNSGGPYTTIASGLTTTNYTDTNIASATNYYVARAGNSSGTSTNSPELRVVAGIDITSRMISAGAVWRYFDMTNDLGTNWHSNSFNDAGWSNGPARLGYGNDGEVTKIASNRQWTTYFRRAFHVPDPAHVTALNARITRDDAAIIHLNGAEVWRDTNITSGMISNQTPALVALSGVDETNWVTLNLQPSALNVLVSGWNILAAEVHNQSLTSSDIGFDFELIGQAILDAPPAMAISNAGGALELAWPSEASYFAPYSATNLNPPVSWSLVTNVAVLSNNQWRVISSVSGSASRFFRLQLR
jgi:rhamnogalacturonan endolyase